MDASLIGQLRDDPALVEQNRYILEVVAAARAPTVGEEDGGEAGVDDEDMPDADAGENDDEEGMPPASMRITCPIRMRTCPTMRRARVNPQSRKRLRSSSFLLDRQIDRLVDDLVVGKLDLWLVVY